MSDRRNGVVVVLEVCESVLDGVCLKAPCLLPYGQCKPWQLLDDAGAKELCAQPDADTRCATLFLRLDPTRIPRVCCN